MTTSFPSSLDAFTNPVGTDLLNSVSVPHATQHDNLNDAVLALETKLGVNGANFPTGLAISGNLSGYAGGEVKFAPTTASANSAISTVATGSPTMSFHHRATSNTGSFEWNNGTSAATQLMSLDNTGQIRAIGSNNRFGAGATGGSGTNWALGSSGDPNNVYLIAEGSGSNVGTGYRTKGTGQHSFQDASGNERLRIDSAAPSSGNTNMYLSYHNGTSVTVQLVTVIAGASVAASGRKFLSVPT